MKRGRPAKRVRIAVAEMEKLCLNCPLASCLGTGSPRCPVRIASRERWKQDYQKRRAAMGLKTGLRRKRGYWPENVISGDSDAERSAL